MVLTLTSLTPPSRLPDWRHLVLFSDEQLAEYDLAAVNLACAEGLPGTEQIDPDYCLTTLDRWADAVRVMTDRLMPQFRRNPARYENSEAFFRAMGLVTVLQRDKGVRYNPEKKSRTAPFYPADVFIHGILQGDGGTCATMPVVYAAVGRRLGYPIKLVSTRGKETGHLFARWDEPATRFNIEATNVGLTTPPDDYFRTDWHDSTYTLSPELEADGCLMVSETPRMELAGFMHARASQWEQVGDFRRAVESLAWTYTLNPRNKLALNSLKKGLYEWDQDQVRRTPPGFPGVLVRRNSRLYPALPEDVEGNIHGLCAMENVLSDPRLEARHWGRMRRGEHDRKLEKLVATFLPDESCNIDAIFT